MRQLVCVTGVHVCQTVSGWDSHYSLQFVDIANAVLLLVSDVVNFHGSE